MVAIDAIAAVVWAAFLTLMFVVLSYLGFVVGGRQDRESHRTAEETPASTAPTDVPSAS